MTITTTTHPLTTNRVSTARLLAAVKDALRAVPKRPNVPILSALRLTGDNNRIVVSGYNYELSVTRLVPAIGEFAPIAVSGLQLRDALARLDQKQEVFIGADGTQVVLRQGTRSVTLKTFAEVEDFPLIPVIHGPIFETTGSTISTIANSLQPFVGKDDNLPVLTASNLTLQGNELRGQATDRFRAAVITRPVASLVSADLTSPEFDGLVPNLTGIAAVLADSVAITVHYDPTLRVLAFSSEEAVITQRLIDGEFPKIERLFPTEAVTTTTFEPVGFLSALKFVEAGVERNCAVQLTAGQAIGIRLIAETEDGNHQDMVPAIVEGEDLETGFNPAFLGDAVKVFGKGREVVMSSTTGTKPSMFTSPSVPDLRVLLMPRRIVA